MQLHPAHIRKLLTADPLIRKMDAPTSEWVEVLADMIGERQGSAPLIAWTYAQELYAGRTSIEQEFDPEEFAESFERIYRQKHETAAAFAEHEANQETEMGGEAEQRARAWFMERYGRYTDWEQVAGSPVITDSFTLIALDPENSRIVHAFEMDA